MLVREVMTSPAVSVRRTDPVRRAIRVLHGHDITAAPVLDDAGRLAGVVSELDLLRGEFEPDPRASMLLPSASAELPPRQVWQVMTHAVVTVTPATDVTTAIDLMVGKRIKSLPVLMDEHVVGMLSRRDLMAMLARPDEELREAVVAALREQYPSGPAWEVTVRDGVAELRLPADEPPDPPAERVADLLTRTVPGILRVRHVAGR
ncbi:HPP family protein [Nonomuraea lactucae]|uniref:CBS domain-containing protein n=1 Tax=Nonomuraea lactucae TaxID=2249762 RepID=UPI000DE22089|nr:CBS domain-containing protein [Nonomuraea lactucae]